MNTKEKIIQSIKADIEREDAYIAEYEILLNVLKNFEGKKITKAMASAVEKQLAPKGYTVGYAAPEKRSFGNLGSYTISIWKTNYNDRRSYTLGHDSTFHVGDSKQRNSGFAYFNTAYGDAAKERNEIRKAQLADDTTLTKLADAFDAYAKAKEVLDSFNHLNTPSIYSIQKALGYKE